MKRQIYLSLIFSMLIVFGFSQSQRMVLLEHFTQASCGPCATYNPQINSLLASNPDKITAIMYHTSWPGYDPMYNHNTVENAARTSYYSVSSVPNSVLDGNIYNGHPNGWNISTVNNRYAVPSPCDISIYHALSADENEFLVWVMIEATEDMPAGLKMHLAAIEKEITFSSPPGSNGETEFFNVMKKMLPNQTGLVLPAIPAGEYIILEYSWEHSNVYDVDQLAAVGFVQNNDTKEVMQAAMSSDEPFDPPYNVDADIMTVSNISQTYCNGYIEPVITIRNNGEAPLTSLDISYTINGGDPVTYNWTGNLGFLEKDIIEMTGSEFTVMDVNTLEVTGASPNGQNDDYMTNNVRTIEIEQAPSVTSPVSLVLKLDNHPEETSWEVKDSQGNVLYEGGDYTTAGQILVEQFQVEDEDCYTFYIYDEGGDGLTEGGSYKLGYSGNIIFAEGTGFGVKDEAQFSINYTGISENDFASDLHVYPVPVEKEVNLSFNLLRNSEVKYSVINPTGEKLFETEHGMQSPGEKIFTINLEEFSPGVYYVILETGTKQTIRKIVLVK
ncbi:MAG: T9SS type A sorting domain-containing protein [Bacteroidales bacterium]|nr:T9SS type A sorting domain-containing protein [Bacteroidales bacterium]